MPGRHFILGTISWVAAATVTGMVLRSELGAQSSSITALTAGVTEWLSGQKRQHNVSSDELMSIALNDPVFVSDADGNFHQVGLVVNVNGTYSKDPQFTQQFQVEIYDRTNKIMSDGFRLDYHTTPMSLDWVVRTVIPRDRQREIAGYIASEWRVHQLEVMQELRPVVRNGLKKAMRAVEAELPQILRSYQDDIQRLSDRYETEILKAEILPLVKEEILPIIEEEAIPIAEETGQALWKRVSLFSFAWRFVYDKSPLPKRDAVKNEFQRFIDEEALPELRSRSDQFVETIEVIVKRSMENPRVKEVLKRNLKRVAEDPELHKVVWSVVKEAIIDNDTLRRELELHLKEQESKAAMKLAGDRLEPMVRQIGDMIFGTREKGITPEFSRILRSQILQKDRRWLVVVPSTQVNASESFIHAQVAAEPMIYPMGFGGTQQSPLTPDSK